MSPFFYYVVEKGTYVNAWDLLCTRPVCLFFCAKYDTLWRYKHHWIMPFVLTGAVEPFEHDVMNFFSPQYGLDLMDLLFWWQTNGHRWFGHDQYVENIFQCCSPDQFIWSWVKNVSRMGLSSSQENQIQNHISCLDLYWDSTVCWSRSSLSRLIRSLLYYNTDIFIPRWWNQTHSDSCACSDQQNINHVCCSLF